MFRRLIAMGSASLLSLTAIAGAAQAQDAGDRFEMTPFIAYRMGGDFDYFDEAADKDRSVNLDDDMSWGIDLGLVRDFNSMYELLYSNQKTQLDSKDPELGSIDLTTQYVHIGGTVFYPGENWFVPFLSGTLGATFFEPSGPYDSETKFSFSLGTGLRFPITDAFAATLGLRGYLTFVDSDSQIFCVSGGGQGSCLLKTSSSTFFQGEASLGLTFRF